MAWLALVILVGIVGYSFWSDFQRVKTNKRLERVARSWDKR